MKTTFVKLSILLFVFSSCLSEQQKEKTISISGAFALYPLVVKWAEEYKKENPEVRFNISGGGAGKGMADALSGAVDLGMVSREIAIEEIEQGAWHVGLTIDAVLPTISSENPNFIRLKKRGLTREEFKSVFIDAEYKFWSDLTGITTPNTLAVYTRSDACGAAGTWAAFLGGKQENLSGIGIFGDPGLAEAIIKDPNGIGFNNTIYIYDVKTGLKQPGIEVIPIDINANGMIDEDEDFYDTFNDILSAIAQGAYPSPPARELYFVSNGKPAKQVTLDFVKWSLTKGQKFVQEAGYVPLSQEKLNQYLKLLN